MFRGAVGAPGPASAPIPPRPMPVPIPVPAPAGAPGPAPAPMPFPNAACDFGLPFVCSSGQEAAFSGVTALSFGGPSRACYFKDGCAVVPEGICALGGGTFFANATSCHASSTPAPGSAPSGLAAMGVAAAPSPAHMGGQGGAVMPTPPTSWSGFGVGGCGPYGEPSAAGCAVASAYASDILVGDGRPSSLPVLGWLPGTAAQQPLNPYNLGTGVGWRGGDEYVPPWAKAAAGSSGGGGRPVNAAAALAAVGPVAPTCPSVFQTPGGGCTPRSQVCAEFGQNTFEQVSCGNKPSMTDPSPDVQNEICSSYGFGSDYLACKKWFPAAS